MRRTTEAEASEDTMFEERHSESGQQTLQKIVLLRVYRC